MKPLVDAQDAVLRAIDRLEPASVDLSAALGLVLADDVVSPDDVPPFTNSAMDGYAVRVADLASLPATLTVVEDVAAGHVARSTVEPGTAIKIMTGAPVPDGANAVIRVEDTSQDGGVVTIRVGADEGTAIRPAGGDVATGAVVFTAGSVLTAAHLGVLAAIGVTRPSVFRRPKVAVLSTGDEVRPPDAVDLQPGQIRDANRPQLVAMVTEAGAEVVDLGIIPDDAEMLREALGHADATCDAIVTSGGVSMGEYDLVKQVITELGEIDLWKVAMQPAKPFAFGTIGSTPLFGLPGNPVSVLVSFEKFVRPALRKMMGHTDLFRPTVTVRAGEQFDTDPEKTVFVRVVFDDERATVRSAGGQASNVLSAAAIADAFAVVPVGTGLVRAGEPVTVELFRSTDVRIPKAVAS